MSGATNVNNGAAPSREQHLRAVLERETNTYRRQELLKALWRLTKESLAEKSQSGVAADLASASRGALRGQAGTTAVRRRDLLNDRVR